MIEMNAKAIDQFVLMEALVRILSQDTSVFVGKVLPVSMKKKKQMLNSENTTLKISTGKM